MTLYSVLLLLHLLAIVVWIGGMVFALFCLRPAAIAVLPPPQRLALLHAALGRFFSTVIMAIALILGSGVAMIGLAVTRHMPISWIWMIGLGAVMIAIFFHVRAAPFARLGACVQTQDWPGAAQQLEKIRVMVLFNLAIGLAIIAVMKLIR